MTGLEETLAVPLVVRHRRGADLTEAGERVADHAREALAALDRVRLEADEVRGLARGKIRIGCFPSVLGTLLPPLLRKFRMRYPGIEVVSLEADDREVEGWLASGTIDLGVVINPLPGRAAAVLGRDAWVPVFPNGHRLARRDTVSLAELAAEPFVLATGGCEVNPLQLAAQAGVALSNIRVEVREWSSAFALIREGVGVSLVPRMALPEIRRGLRIGFLSEPVYRSFGLVASPATQTLRTVNAFVRVAQEGIGAQRPRS